MPSRCRQPCGRGAKLDTAGVILLMAMLLTACGMPDVEEILHDVDASPEKAESRPTPEDMAEPTPDPFQTEVVISELQPSNKVTMRDADGDYSDWIELYNPGAESADLTGCWLSDSDKEPCKWQIPSLTLESGEYRVVFCSKGPRRRRTAHQFCPVQGRRHALSLLPLGHRAAAGEL